MHAGSARCPYCGPHRGAIGGLECRGYACVRRAASLSTIIRAGGWDKIKILSVDVATGPNCESFDQVSIDDGCCLAKALDPNNRLRLAMPQPENGPPNKRAKIPDQFVFTNPHDIKQTLRTSLDPNVLSKGLWLVYDHRPVPQLFVQPFLH